MTNDRKVIAALLDAAAKMAAIALVTDDEKVQSIVRAWHLKHAATLAAIRKAIK